MPSFLLRTQFVPKTIIGMRPKFILLNISSFISSTSSVSMTGASTISIVSSLSRFVFLYTILLLDLTIRVNLMFNVSGALYVRLRNLAISGLITLKLPSFS